MYEVREIKGKFQTKENIDVKWVGLEGLKEAIVNAETRLTNVEFDVGLDYEYGEEVAYAVLYGWRESTPEEIEYHKVKQAEITKQQEDWEQRQIENLKKTRPELFK